RSSPCISFPKCAACPISATTPTVATMASAISRSKRRYMGGSWHDVRVRVLVLTAAIGEGHVTAARSLAARLERRPEVDAVDLRSDLDVLGSRLGPFLTAGFHTHLE